MSEKNILPDPGCVGRWLIGVLALILVSGLQPVLAEPAFEELTILVPASQGSGWDHTAQAMSQVLRSTGSARSVNIIYSPGAGGVIGMAQFISSRNGQGNALLVGGLFTVGAVIRNQAAVSLLDTTPLARLTFDHGVVAVPASSSIKTASDLIEAMRVAPESISWVGGSRAGVDEINVFEIARSLGVSPSRLHYTGLPGGGDVAEALASGKYQAGVSGYSEFEALVQAGRLRIIASANADPSSDNGVPSLEQMGIEINRFNWRGVFAPPGLSPDQIALLSNVIEKMVASEQWQQLLIKNHWQDAYLPGNLFVDFVRSEQAQVVNDLAAMQEVDDSNLSVVNSVLVRRYIWALGLAVFCVLLIVGMFLQRSRAHQREEGLQDAFEKATGEVSLRTEELDRAMNGIHAQIEKEFDQWSLTLAEREIALLLLKGLRLKEIADLRGTSERTVRQQAQAVYKKAGLVGRSDLAAYFLEDFLLSVDEVKLKDKD